MATAPVVEASTAGLIQAGGLVAAPEQEREGSSGLIGAAEPEEKESSAEEPAASEAKEPAAASATEPAKLESAKEPSGAKAGEAPKKAATAAESERLPVPLWLWIVWRSHRAIAILYALGMGTLRSL